MEKPKVKKRKRKRISKEDVLWRKILERDLALNEYALYESGVHISITQQALELEKKRKPGDYIK